MTWSNFFHLLLHRRSVHLVDSLQDAALELVERFNSDDTALGIVRVKAFEFLGIDIRNP